MPRLIIVTAIVLAAFSAPSQAIAQPNDQVASRAVTIWSDGTKLAGDIFYPKDMDGEEKLPGIVLCHGWGGVKSHLNRTYAPKFAAAGFVVLTFDYRGWGESDSRLVIDGDMPTPDDNGMLTVRARAIRELVDPFDQLEDIHNAINFLEGESIVDTQRIGIWGTSFGGGLVVWTAAHDDRVACVVSQVGAMDGRSSVARLYADKGGLAGAHARAVQRSRGEAPPVPQGENTFPGLQGTPYLDRFALYAPVDFAGDINVPLLLIDAENEELFDRRQHSAKVYDLVKDRVPSEYHVVPGIKHYGIYAEKYILGSDLALDWFTKYLK